jgi:hypothetical protein
MELLSEYLTVENLTLIISICAAIAMATPSNWDNVIVNVLRKIVDLGGLNFLNAKNEEPKK